MKKKFPTQEQLLKRFEIVNDELIYKEHFHKSKIGTKAYNYMYAHMHTYTCYNKKYYKTEQIIYMMIHNIYAKYTHNLDNDPRNVKVSNIINLKTLEKPFDFSQSMIKERIDYSPSTGEVRWKATKDRCNIGNPVLGEDAHGYKIINIDYKVYKLHAIIWLYMTGEKPNIVDHIDHNRQNNIFSNLKNGTCKDNSKNLSKSILNTSGTTGVTIRQGKYGKKFISNITVDGVSKFLGCFDLIDDAIAARKDANVKYGFHVNHGADKVVETSWRSSREYRIWRIFCIRRDVRCKMCGDIKNRQVHHMDNAEDHPGSRFDVNNGVTLCRSCHTQYHCNFHNSFREKTTKYDFENFKVLFKYIKEKTIFIDKDKYKDKL